MVVHQGEQPWTDPVDVRDLIAIGSDTAAPVEEHLIRQRFRLEDTGRFDPATLASSMRQRPFTPLVKTMLWMMRTVRRNPGLDQDLPVWLDVLHQVRSAPDGAAAYALVSGYLIHVSETPIDKLRTVMSQLGPEAEEDFMTTADMLIAEGKAKGLAEGEAKGEARGSARTLTQVLTLRFGPLPDHVRSKLQAASVEELDAWTERAITAATLDDVFA